MSRSPGFRALATALGLLAGFSQAAQAQSQQTGAPTDWTVLTDDNGSLVIGMAMAPDHGLWVSCNAPSAQGRPVWETGSHEETLTDPFELVLGFREDLFSGAPPIRQEGAVLIVGTTSYTLPGFETVAMNGPEVLLPMGAPLVQALYDAPSLRLVSAQGAAHPFPTAGLGAALDGALRACVNRWAEIGHTIPVALSRYWPVVDEGIDAGQAPAVPTASVAGIPRFDIPAGIPRFAITPGLAPAPGAAAQTPFAATSLATLPPVIVQHVYQTCGGSARIDETALSPAQDFDGDGAPDYVINYTGVYCQQDTMRGFCGAANCSIEVFLSSRGHIRAFDFLAIAATPAKAPDGRIGLRLAATPFICGDGYCDGIWLWDGQRFAQQP